MKKKLQNITNKLSSVIAIVLLLIGWQLLSVFHIVPNYMLPSPVNVVVALVTEFNLLMFHARITMLEALLGLGLGVVIGFVIAVVMDHYNPLYRAIYPILVITQTIPTVAMAPLLVLWFGYGITPKVVLIVIVTFFPITVGLLEGFRSVDPDTIHLLQSMGASRIQIFHHVKVKSAMGQFFASLRISTSYAVIGAVISEWLGGFNGLGVYMTRVKKSYSFDKMFAVILLISAISLMLMYIVNLLKKKCMPWQRNELLDHGEK